MSMFTSVVIITNFKVLLATDNHTVALDWLDGQLEDREMQVNRCIENLQHHSLSKEYTELLRKTQVSYHLWKDFKGMVDDAFITNTYHPIVCEELGFTVHFNKEISFK